MSENNEILKYYEKEEQLLINSLNEVEDLYNETKKHLDDIKNSHARGSLTFLEKQTSNLVSLKSTKLQIVKEMINVKKIAKDYELKTKADSSSINNDIINNLYKKLVNMDEDMEEEEYENDDYGKSSSSIDSILDSKINSLIKEGKINFSENDLNEMNKNNSIIESNESSEGKIIILMKDDKWKFAMINEMNKIIKNAPVPNKNDFQIRFEVIDGKRYGIDQNDKMYEVKKVKSK